jgi:hypothetical protein
MRVRGKHQVVVVANLMLLVGEIRVIDRVVTQMERCEAMLAARKVERPIEVGAREGVLREVRILREIEEICGKPHEAHADVQACRREAYALIRIDDGAFGDQEISLACEVR